MRITEKKKNVFPLILFVHLYEFIFVFLLPLCYTHEENVVVNATLKLYFFLQYLFIKH